MFGKMSQNRLTVSRLLKQSILELCKASVPQQHGLEIDGIVCITLGSEEEQIVVKVHEVLGTPRTIQPATSSGVADCHDKKKLVKNQALSNNDNDDTIHPSRDLNEPLLKVSGIQSEDEEHLEISLGEEEENAQTDRPGGRNESAIQERQTIDEGEMTKTPARKATTESEIKDSIGNTRKRTIDAIRLSTIKVEMNSDDEDGKGAVQEQASLWSRHGGARFKNHLVCEYCHVLTLSYGAFKEHNENMHGARTCDYCWRSFLFESNYNLHIKTHVRERVRHSKYMVPSPSSPSRPGSRDEGFKCGLCSEVFNNGDCKQALAHLKTNHKFQQMYTCIICEEYFPSRETYRMHRHLMHPHVAQCTCRMCGMGFTVEEFPHHRGECLSLQSSEAAPRSTDTKSPPIKRTKQNTLTLLLDSQHLSLEEQRDIFLLKNKAPQVSSTSGNILGSLEIVTSPVAESSELVFNAEGDTSQRKESTSHEQNRDDDGEGDQVFEKVDVSLSELAAACSAGVQIQSVYSSKQSYQIRRRIEEADSRMPCKGPYRCYMCDDLFLVFEHFEKHCLEVHWRFVCPYCAQTFATKRNVRRHMRKHTGEQPYMCWECNQTFYRDDDLRRHRVARHGHIKFYSCAYCQISIAERLTFTEHLKTEHNMTEDQLTEEEMAKHYVL